MNGVKILYPRPYVGRFLAVSDSKIELMVILRVSYVTSRHCAGIFWCASSPFPILSLTLFLVDEHNIFISELHGKVGLLFQQGKWRKNPVQSWKWVKVCPTW